MATIAISTIYMVWQSYTAMQTRRQEVLRERVAFMLWEMAKRVG